MTKRTLLLQVNDRGSWRNMLRYPADRDEEICEHAAFLARIAQVKLRVVGPDGRAISWWTEERGWHNALELPA